MEQSVIIICVGTDHGSTGAEIEGEPAQSVHRSEIEMELVVMGMLDKPTSRNQTYMKKQ